MDSCKEWRRFTLKHDLIISLSDEIKYNAQVRTRLIRMYNSQLDKMKL
jgi:hypothetical protein